MSPDCSSFYIEAVAVVLLGGAWRIIIIFFIFGGVIFFGSETSEIVEIFNDTEQGHGSYVNHWLEWKFLDQMVLSHGIIWILKWRRFAQVVASPFGNFRYENYPFQFGPKVYPRFSGADLFRLNVHCEIRLQHPSMEGIFPQRYFE